MVRLFTGPKAVAMKTPATCPTDMWDMIRTAEDSI